MDERLRNDFYLGKINMLHIFIVSLKQDIEKRETISKVLNDFNLDFTFIDAVYGKELPDNYLDTIRNKSAGSLVNRSFPATPGEIGCTLSHLKVYQEVINRGLEWACILEDDVILDGRFKKFVENFESEKLNPLNLYLLGGQIPTSKKLIIKSIKNIQLIGYQSFHKTIKSERIIYRTCCYLISSDLARNLILLGSREFILADDWAYLIRKGLIKNIYLSDFVDHPIDLTDSHIQKEREEGLSTTKEKMLSRTTAIRRRVNNSIRWRLRVLVLKAYRYIEREDKF